LPVVLLRRFASLWLPVVFSFCLSLVHLIYEKSKEHRETAVPELEKDPEQGSGHTDLC
jgi:hypothetical protein